MVRKDARDRALTLVRSEREALCIRFYASTLAIPLAAITLNHHKPKPRHFKHHPECRTIRCARHADRLWSKLHRPKPHRSSASSSTGFVIPYYIVYCESKGTNEPANGPLAASGYYQIIPETWRAYGGSPPDDAAQHSKAEQDAVAARIWDGGRGRGQWACA